MSLKITQEYLDEIQEVQEIERIYLANSLQQGFIYHYLNQGDTDDAYKVQLVLEYNTEKIVNRRSAQYESENNPRILR